MEEIVYSGKYSYEVFKREYNRLTNKLKALGVNQITVKVIANNYRLDCVISEKNFYRDTLIAKQENSKNLMLHRIVYGDFRNTDFDSMAENGYIISSKVTVKAGECDLRSNLKININVNMCGIKGELLVYKSQLDKVTGGLNSINKHKVESCGVMPDDIHKFGKVADDTITLMRITERPNAQLSLSDIINN